jgi:hypothetical protein
MPTTTQQRPSPTHALPRMTGEAGVRYGLAHAGLVLVALAAAATRVPLAGSLVLLTLAALVGARGLGLGWRVAIALAAWAVWTGFFEHSVGVLTFSGGDLVRLAALTGLAAACTHRVVRPWSRLAP